MFEVMHFSTLNADHALQLLLNLELDMSALSILDFFILHCFIYQIHTIFIQIARKNWYLLNLDVIDHCKNCAGRAMDLSAKYEWKHYTQQLCPSNFLEKIEQYNEKYGNELLNNE